MSIDRLLAIMQRLRDPERGCPWDLEQSFETIAPYTIEEAYEVEDAVCRGNWNDLRDELGDLLLQVVFHAQLGSEASHFDFDSVVEAVCDKLVRRHPHVFSAEPTGVARGADAVRKTWEERKALERADKAETRGAKAGVFDDVSRTFPALLRAAKLQKRAQRAGIEPGGSPAKLAEAAERFSKTQSAEDLGALLFCAVEAGRRAGVDAESTLRAANDRFEREHG